MRRAKIIPSLLCSLAIAICIAGCQSSGIVRLSPDSYMLCKNSAAGMFANMPKLRASVIGEANAFAESKGKIALPISSHDSRPPFGFPTFEYQFRLVDTNALQATRAAMPEEEHDLYSELIKLDDLRKKGLLTDAEFDAQKKKLLDGKK